MYRASSGVLTDKKTSGQTYSPAKPETTARKSSVTTKRPAVLLLGKKPVIHECLSKKRSSSDKNAASSNTMERYKSEIAITIQARNRQPRKTDATPIAETKAKITMRTISLLVSLLTTERRFLYDTFSLRI